ncbi:hypothetical protein PFISCL1PPCAC_4720 [Pristionchus fissidentatus]|uniref:Uncharacterized protein n=1 Tax=Pristionchus fissidentatus TaxID=1538716 RepID=A0AAV5V568_9BILA|nr:hypothetical protein PFISCL1PPCAC_4720 [Pristionchus fissidentatus]
MAGTLATVLIALSALTLTASLSIPTSYIEALCRGEGCGPTEKECRVWFSHSEEKYKAQCLMQRQPEPEPLDEEGIRALCAKCYPQACQIHYDDDFVAGAKCIKRGKRC